MELTVTTNPDISLSDLQAFQAEGFSVMRSAHVGNARMYNLVLASAGIPILLVDHNLTGSDKNYLPGAIIQDGQVTEIAEPGQLSLRTQVTNPATGEQQYLDELHAGALAQAFPKTDVFTNTDYLQRNAGVAAEIARIGVAANPYLFRRTVQTGSSQVTNGGGVEMAQRGDILQLQDNPRTDRGALLPNELDILANFVIEALNSGRSTQYHVSGPDMVNYLKNILPDIQALYRRLEETPLGKQLPRLLNVQLVPGAALRIAGSSGYQAECEDLAHTMELLTGQLTNSHQEKKVFFTAPGPQDPEARRSLLERLRFVEDSLKTTAKLQLQAYGDPLIGPREAPFVSQYDLPGPDSLFVPEYTAETSIRDLQRLFDIVQKYMRPPT